MVMRHQDEWLRTRLHKRSTVSSSGCRIWHGATTGHKNPAFDYGIMWDGEKRQLTHRLALEIKLGRRLARGMCSCHTCDTPLCLEETHLFEGTRAKNLEDMRIKGRDRAKPKGTPAKVRGADHVLAKLTKRQAIAIYTGTDTAKAAAARFGVSKHLVDGIRQRKNWTWATKDLPDR